MLQHKSARILQDVLIPNCTQKTYEKHPNITKYPWKMKIFAVNLESFTPDGKCLHRHHLGCLWQIWILLQNVNLRWCPLAKCLTTWKMETKDQDQFRQHSRLYMDGHKNYASPSTIVNYAARVAKKMRKWDERKLGKSIKRIWHIIPVLWLNCLRRQFAPIL